MNAILMAGGEGTRLKSIWPDQPKPMIPLLGKPVMEHLLGWVKHNGVGHVRATLRYKPGAITEYFGDGSAFGLNLQYSVESAPLGTAGGVRECADFYGDRDFFVLSGDAVCDYDLRALAECHRRTGAAVTIALTEAAVPMGYGLVLHDQWGIVRRFIEKPDWRRVVTDRVNTGVYVVSARAMSYVPPKQPFDFARDLFPRLLEAGEKVIALPMSGYWCDVGTPRAYYRCNLDALDGRVRLYGRDGKPLDTPAEANTPTPAAEESLRGGYRVEIPCTSRARLMRLLSEKLMFEAGADFSDGLSLPGAHFAPDPEKEAVVLDAADETQLSKWEQYARSLGEAD